MVLDKPIIAIDFDGTITTGDNRIWKDNVPENDVFFENKGVTDFIKKYRQEFYLILWTCRNGESLKRAINYSKSIGIDFDAVNHNMLGVFETSNKIYADFYLDDKGTFSVEDIKHKCKIL